ncbi:hypothetical protein DHEL01_v212792 [Diaporthe helianthi]|uniref:Uncharacterized protein n=1 Tax=Diaporthe helianthi TaxID=158607 RepID=A0A2P5HEY1_DIAHE|nr:hypothetical protein DHEL01_v212792 [Diaporthe helianthi]
MVQGRGIKVREHDERSSTPAPLRSTKRVWEKSLSQGKHETSEGVKGQDGAWRVAGQVQTGATGVSSVNGFVQK